MWELLREKIRENRGTDSILSVPRLWRRPAFHRSDQRREAHCLKAGQCLIRGEEVQKRLGSFGIG